MRLLVLGGTAWLSGTVAREALARGHDVTCLARGEAGRAPDGVTFIRADRDEPGAYDEVSTSHWDAIVDVSRQPGHVRRAVKALSPLSDFFVFVSSANAYADHTTPNADESAEIREPLAGDVMEDMETYGEAKVACELAVLEAFGADRTAVIRAGLIGGPGDVSDRSGYWPLRFARPSTDDASVLVPEAPELTAQLIDVRDLAAWMVGLAETQTSGVFNGTGETLGFAEHLDVARRVAQHTGPLVTVSEQWLGAHEVAPWAGERSLALWLPLPEYAGFTTRDSSAARKAGLVTRPLAQTLADTLEWELHNAPDRPRKAGLADVDERDLIAAARQSAH